MRIGYACICLGQENCKMRTCTMNYANEIKLMEIIEANLNALQAILSYNVAHGIQMFRISSDLIPFASSEVNTLHWQTIFASRFHELGVFIRHHNLRVSLHPGQYTLLNAKNKEIVERSIKDLRYHCEILDLMQLDSTHKLILHVGGVYQDKEASMARFLCVYKKLSTAIRKRLVIENDDRYYTIEDVLELSKYATIPVVFDNLHHELNPPQTQCAQEDWIRRVASTWKQEDGVCKVHYSEQAEEKRPGAHAKHITAHKFMFFVMVQKVEVDIMLEVKDKNFSALKACALLAINPCFYHEWRYYRYLLYLYSLRYYVVYEELFKEQKKFDRLSFFQIIEEAMKRPLQKEPLSSLLHLLELEYIEEISEYSKKRIQHSLQVFQKKQIDEKKLLGIWLRIAEREHCSELYDGLMLVVLDLK